MKVAKSIERFVHLYFSFGLIDPCQYTKKILKIITRKNKIFKKSKAIQSIIDIPSFTWYFSVSINPWSNLALNFPLSVYLIESSSCQHDTDQVDFQIPFVEGTALINGFYASGDYSFFVMNC